MSSLAPAPKAAALRARRAGHPARRRVAGDSLLGLAVAAGLSLLAFTTTGGGALAPTTANTIAQIVLVLIAGGLGAAVALLGTRGRAWGGVTLLLFTLLVALTFASIAWSVQPAYSWLEANRTLSYCAAFAAALALARLAPDRWPGLLAGVGLYALVICGWALLTKVFPASLDPSDALGRLGVPFSYYNATGLVAAMGIPAWLWLGAAHPDPGAGTTLARLRPVVSVPALGLLVCTLVLSYGRGALVALLIGLGVWFVLAPDRLRGALVLALGALGGVVASVWATRQMALSHDYVPLPLRTSAGHRFGVVLLIALALLTLAGAAVAYAREHVVLSSVVRRRIGTALIVLLCLVPVAGVGALAASSRGLGGEVSHLWTSLTSPNSAVTDNPSRLAELGSSRPRYWRDGLKVGAHAPWAGTGAFGFYTAERKYTRDTVTHAHSYVVQTFADFGALGLVISGALLIAWILAARRTVRTGREVDDDPGALPSDRRPEDGARPREHAGLVALLAIAVVFGVHSTIDWTWFIPGVAVPAMLCAGWLAGRGPARALVGRLPRVPSLTAHPLRAAAALGVLFLVLAGAWFIWQPLRALDADNGAFAAIQRGDGATALADARTAASADPVDTNPLQLLSSLYAAFGDPARARAELVKATTLQPANPDTWVALASFDTRHGRSAEAQRERARARALEPFAKIAP